MKKVIVTYSILLLLSFQIKSQDVGIGTATPNAQAILHIDVGSSTTKGLIMTGTAITGSVPDLGTGPKLLFFPGKAAFREGYTNGNQWYNVNTGYYSVAMGANTTASLDYAVEMGGNTTASAQYSVAMGGNTTASGTYSTALGGGSAATANYAVALGGNTQANGIYSVAMGGSSIAGGQYSVAGGFSSNASNNYATAFGYSATAGGLYSFAAGNTCTASGTSSFAMGAGATASGDYSVAIGHSVNTNLKTGGFFLADSDPFNKGVRIVGSNDQMCMRFNGGYYLISNNNGADIGVQVLAGGNSWAVISDKRRKENFLKIDGEDFLYKISKLPLTTWNYKGQDIQHFRHYGPMAQDFFAAFGKDGLGTIGCDSLINQQDLIGVNLVAIQALEKRTESLKEENGALKGENGTLKGEVTVLKNEVAEMKERLTRIEKAMR